jgi:hypothetical protein
MQGCITRRVISVTLNESVKINQRKESMGKGKKNSSIQKRLVAYSAAAAGMLAVTPAANAAIQYSGLRNIVVNPGNPTVFIDLNNDGKNDFKFSLFSSYLYMSLAQSGSSVIEENVHHLPANLPNNYLIKQTLNNPNYWTSSVSSSTVAGPIQGNFKGSRGFIGVKFHTTGGSRYGWIQFDGASWPTQGIIVDWAYEDSGAPIAAGNGNNAGAVGVPATHPWGLLILITLLAGASLRGLKKGPEET